MDTSKIKVIAFDADDTLWDCQSHFEAVEREYCRLLKPYGDETFVSEQLFKTETANMAELGYGSKAFTLSLVIRGEKFTSISPRPSLTIGTGDFLPMSIWFERS